MRNRVWILLSLLLVTALVLGACAGSGSAPAEAPAEEAAAEEPAAEEEAAEETEPTEEPEEEAAEEPAEEAAAAEGGLTIWADDTRAPVLESLGEAFEAEYGIPIIVTEKAFGDIRDDLAIAGPTGEGPDIIIGAHDWLGQLVENGLVAEMSLGDGAEQFLPAAVQGFTYDGVLYGMPYATENVAFVYNPEMVDEVPATWSELTELAAQLEADGVVKQGYIRQEGDPYHFFPIQTAFGGYVFGLTDEGYDANDVGIDNEGSIAAAEWLDQMVKDGHLDSKAAVDYDIMHAAYESGDAAMMITGPWALPRIRESGTPYAVATIPGETQEAQPFLGIQGFMISNFSEDPLLAQTFLQEFVANEEVMQQIFEADPRPSAYIPVREAIADEDLAAFAEAGVNGLAMPAIPAMSAVWDSWGNAVTLVTQQGEEPAAAFENAAEQVRTAIAE